MFVQLEHHLDLNKSLT